MDQDPPSNSSPTSSSQEPGTGDQNIVTIGDGAQVGSLAVGKNITIYAGDLTGVKAMFAEMLALLRDVASSISTAADAHLRQDVHLIANPKGTLKVTAEGVGQLGGLLREIYPNQLEAIYLVARIILDEPYLRWDREYVRLKGTLHGMRFRDPDNPGISGQGAVIKDVRDALKFSADKNRLRLVIVGAPGAGKTTTLDRLALDLARRRLRDPYNEKLPVRIDLSKFERTDQSPEEFLEDAYRRLGLNENYGQAINFSRVCFLLDGVNEMPFADRRVRVQRWADWAARDLPGSNWAVFASRPGYEADLDLPQVVVQELDRDAIREYLTRRFDEKRAVELERDFDERFRAGDDRFEQLARNPLFLSLLADQIKERQEIASDRVSESPPQAAAAAQDHQEKLIPVSRAHLLAGLASRRLNHELKRGRVPQQYVEQHPQIKQGIMDALSRIAFAAREQGKPNTITQTLAVQALAGHPTPLTLVEILNMANAATLIQETGADGYKFWHHLLQEYFAANELVSRFRAGADLTGTWRVPWRSEDFGSEPLVADATLAAPPVTGWEESVIIAGGLADGDAPRFIAAVRPDNLPLAGRTLAEMASERTDLVELTSQLRAELLERQRDRGAHLRARIAAGLALGQVGHPELTPQEFRFEGQSVWAILPQLEPVMEGAFVRGSAPDDEGAYRNEFTSERRILLPPYEIGRYPVTNAEFQFFYQYGGYQDERWWSAAGWEWRKGGPDAHSGAIEGWLRQRQMHRDYGVEEAGKVLNWKPQTVQYWKEMVELDDDAARRRAAQVFERSFDQPGYWQDPQLNNHAQPVVGINWYEAEAYCKWLAAVTGRPLRLPTEMEWEKAARGTEGQTYPWEGEFDSSRCNSVESGIFNTTPVGMYEDGKSPFGMYDASGNVWEWTGDWYRMYDGGDPEASSDFDKNYRVVRGGSFDDDRRDVRCAFRFRSSPDEWGDFIGFRVVLPGS